MPVHDELAEIQVVTRAEISSRDPGSNGQGKGHETPHPHQLGANYERPPLAVQEYEGHGQTQTHLSVLRSAGTSTTQLEQEQTIAHVCHPQTVRKVETDY